jgi:poly-gamma-glutamate capsule biosynthesis protein CapA/YwtB (metallophosphatase superfamily)
VPRKTKVVPRYIKNVLKNLLYPLLFKVFKILRIWRFPADRDPEQNPHKFLNRIYWKYKQINPIVKPEKGSGLEVYFAKKRRQIDRLLLPEGFRGDASVAVSAVGDLMNTPGIEDSAGKFYAKVEDLIFDADISIANLESTLTSAEIDTRQITQNQINATGEQFDVFKGHQGKHYTIFCTANNHILDRGMEGFNTTHNRLKNEGYLFSGTNLSPEAQKKGLIITSNGIKFGFVAATYETNRTFPNQKDYLVNVISFHRFQGPVNVSLLEKQISYCKSHNCDFIIVSLHWGMEFEFFPRQNQVDIAHHLIEYGADAIISHHTHNIQPYEFYQTRRDQDRKAPIFYGLGNLSTLWSAPYLVLSLIASFDVIKGVCNGISKTLVKHVNVTPVLQMKYDNMGKPYFQIEKLSHLIRSACSEKKTEYIGEACKYADLVLGKGWRN